MPLFRFALIRQWPVRSFYKEPHFLQHISLVPLIRSRAQFVCSLVRARVLFIRSDSRENFGWGGRIRKLTAALATPFKIEAVQSFQRFTLALA
jgi:hypothetical protein